MDAKPVFLLAGDEQFLKEEWLLRIRREFFNDDPNSADFNIFHTQDTDLSEVLTIARTEPFLAKRRLIVIKDLDSLASEADHQQLLKYARSPSPRTVLILETDVKERDIASDRFLSELGKISQKVFFKKLYDQELSGWINKNFLLKKKKIAHLALELLKELKGNDLQTLFLEIEKLSVHAGQLPMINLEDVQALVGNDVTSNVYDMIDALSQDDKTAALTLGLGVQKNDLGNVIGLLCWNLRRILKVREYLKEERPLKKIEGHLDLKRFQVDRFVHQAKRLKSSWIKKSLLELTDLDLKLKTSSLDDSLLGWEIVITRLLTSA